LKVLKYDSQAQACHSERSTLVRSEESNQVQACGMSKKNGIGSKL
jgi:hypothetical protein